MKVQDLAELIKPLVYLNVLQDMSLRKYQAAITVILKLKVDAISVFADLIVEN
jgi:hypothetical protein